MNISSVLAACWSEMAALVRSIVSLLVFVGLFFIISSLAPAGDALGVQSSVVIIFMFVALLGIALSAKNRRPGWKTWIGVNVGIVALGAAAVAYVPAHSGYIAGIAFVLLVAMPSYLDALARRRSAGGYAQAAAFYARIVRLLHPSRLVCFQSSFLTAHALRSAEEKIAAYRALAARATPEQVAALNCCISIARDDWKDVLGQVRSGGFAAGGRLFEIRALGELGRVDEMVKTFALAEIALPATELPFARLQVLANTGHPYAVCFLLGQQLRFVRPRNKAYWTFISEQAVGTCDEETRRLLESYVRADKDETFRRTAQRHLDAGPMPGAAALSAESHAVIKKLLEKMTQEERRRWAR